MHHKNKYIYYIYIYISESVSCSLQVQATASSAMDWCLKSGGRVEADDLVSKIANLGAGGNHKANIERDFHTLLKSFSRRLGATLSTARARTVIGMIFLSIQIIDYYLFPRNDF